MFRYLAVIFTTIRIFHICIAWGKKPSVRRKPIRRLALLGKVFRIFYNNVQNIHKTSTLWKQYDLYTIYLYFKNFLVIFKFLDIS